MLQRIIEVAGQKTQVTRHDSVQELIASAQSVSIPADNDNVVTEDWEFIGERFPRGWAQVFGKLAGVWTEGLAILDKMLKQLGDAAIEKPVSRRRKVRFDETDGDEVDYDRLRCGQPMWRTSRRTSSRAPSTIAIVVNIATPASKDSDTILWRGAAAIILTKLLEAAGYRVELWATGYANRRFSSQKNSRWDVDGFDVVRLKAAGDPLDESTLIAAVAGWCYRTVWFRSYYATELQTKPSYGSPRSLNDTVIDEIVAPGHKRVRVENVWSFTEALALVRSTIDSLK